MSEAPQYDWICPQCGETWRADRQLHCGPCLADRKDVVEGMRRADDVPPPDGIVEVYEPVQDVEVSLRRHHMPMKSALAYIGTVRRIGGDVLHSTGPIKGFGCRAIAFVRALDWAREQGLAVKEAP